MKIAIATGHHTTNTGADPFPRPGRFAPWQVVLLAQMAARVSLEADGGEDEAQLALVAGHLEGLGNLNGDGGGFVRRRQRGG